MHTFSDEQEEWRPISGFEGYYEVSNLGRIRSLDRIIYRSNGRPHPWKGQILSLSAAGKTGYLHAVLRKGKESTAVRAHRVVAETFIPNPEGHPLVLHNDGSRTNNRVDNLRWGTTSDNIRDSMVHGTYRNGMAIRTHCKNGHEFNEVNTQYRENGRRCRVCSRENQRRYTLRKVA